MREMYGAESSIDEPRPITQSFCQSRGRKIWLLLSHIVNKGVYAGGKGRDSRMEFSLSLVIYPLVSWWFAWGVGFIESDNDTRVALRLFIGVTVFCILFICGCVRRIHDIGMSALWILLPLVGLAVPPRPWVFLAFVAAGGLYLCLCPSDPRDNKHGPAKGQTTAKAST